MTVSRHHPSRHSVEKAFEPELNMLLWIVVGVGGYSSQKHAMSTKSGLIQCGGPENAKLGSRLASAR